jgi:hypothetical protein
VLTIGLFITGLWPFNFRADNKAVLMPEGKGLRFYALLQTSSLVRTPKVDSEPFRQRKNPFRLFWRLA